jgi:16S rRNA (guanine527-N7)-methyltransferase
MDSELISKEALQTQLSLLKQHFPELTEQQMTQFERLAALYVEWNSKINVVSRKDIMHIVEHHIMHSLAIAKVLHFRAGTEILDLGTGGGLPGIPLAIYFPECYFTLIDSRHKKAFVTQEIIKELGLENCRALQMRAEEFKEKFEFVVSRAVAPIDKLRAWTQHLLVSDNQNALPNGIITLKGGNPKAEQKLLEKFEYSEIYPLRKYFKSEYYEEKYLMYVQH